MTSHPTRNQSSEVALSLSRAYPHLSNYVNFTRKFTAPFQVRLPCPSSHSVVFSPPTLPASNLGLTHFAVYGLASSLTPHTFQFLWQ